MKLTTENLKKARRVNTPIPESVLATFEKLERDYPDDSEARLGATLLAAGAGDRTLLDALLSERITLAQLAMRLDTIGPAADPSGAIERLRNEIAAREHDVLAEISSKTDQTQKLLAEACSSCSRTQKEVLAGFS